jgi:hypothetical protein
MTAQQTAILQDLKARIDRALFEDDFDRALIDVGQDCSSVLMDESATRLTAGEWGKISLNVRIK